MPITSRTYTLIQNIKTKGDLVSEIKIHLLQANHHLQSASHFVTTSRIRSAVP